MTFFVDGDNELGDVRDELVALSLPQRFHTHFHVLNQHFLGLGETQKAGLELRMLEPLNQAEI